MAWPWITAPEPLDVLIVGGGNVALVAGGRPHFLFCVAPGARVRTDGWLGYRGLDKLGYDHDRRSQRAAKAIGEDPGELLPRVHRVISDLKSWLQGTHRGVSGEHLPVYLDEYVFRFNRRRTPMAAFQTLLGMQSNQQPTRYDEIAGLTRQPELTG